MSVIKQSYRVVLCSCCNLTWPVIRSFITYPTNLWSSGWLLFCHCFNILTINTQITSRNLHCTTRTLGTSPIKISLCATWNGENEDSLQHTARRNTILCYDILFHFINPSKSATVTSVYLTSVLIINSQTLSYTNTDTGSVLRHSTEGSPSSWLGPPGFPPCNLHGSALWPRDAARSYRPPRTQLCTGLRWSRLCSEPAPRSWRRGWRSSFGSGSAWCELWPLRLAWGTRFFCPDGPNGAAPDPGCPLCWSQQSPKKITTHVVIL